MWERRDPVPGDLADRVLFALWLENLDAHVAVLIQDERQSELVGARADDEGRTITFGTDSLTVVLSISDRPDGLVRIDGWVTPAGAGEVVARLASGLERTTVVDADGRFALDGLVSGLIQLVYRQEGEHGAIAAPPITL
jgi:hypothetical protein